MQTRRVGRSELQVSEVGLGTWCLRASAISSVIVGATQSEQLKENCKASGLRLPSEMLDRIDEICPGPLPIPAH